MLQQPKQTLGHVPLAVGDLELLASVDHLHIPKRAEVGHVLLGLGDGLVDLLVLGDARQEVGDRLLRVRPLVVLVAQLHPVIIMQRRLIITDRFEEDELHWVGLLCDALDHLGAAFHRRVRRIKDPAHATPTRSALRTDPTEQLLEALHRELLSRGDGARVRGVEEGGVGAGETRLPAQIPRVEELRRATQEVQVAEDCFREVRLAASWEANHCEDDAGGEDVVWVGGVDASGAPPLQRTALRSQVERAHLRVDGLVAEAEAIAAGLGRRELRGQRRHGRGAPLCEELAGVRPRRRRPIALHRSALRSTARVRHVSLQNPPAVIPRWRTRNSQL